MPPTKPLGMKAYGHIPHLPGSRVGPGDHSCTEGQARIATEKTRNKGDVVICQAKLDGTCVAIANVSGELIPLTRSGYRAETSPYEQHHRFVSWFYSHLNYERFWSILDDGCRMVGEWLIQAHGTRYNLPHEPFIAFDLMRGHDRFCYELFKNRVQYDFVVPAELSVGPPVSIEEAMDLLGPGKHGELDPPEGIVWRVERENGETLFLCKYVRPDKVDGLYLPEISGKEPMWNLCSENLSGVSV